MVAAAHVLAVYHNTKVFQSHLELVTGLSEEFESDFGGRASNKQSYFDCTRNLCSSELLRNSSSEFSYRYFTNRARDATHSPLFSQIGK